MDIDKNIKILIVEDEVVVAMEIKKILESNGYIVTNIVTNYNNALQSYKVCKPDIIFMDINLENSKDGIDIALEIKKYDDISIIYLTAFCDDETIHRAMKTQPVSYIVKPFKNEDILSSVSQCLYKIGSTTKEIINSSLKYIGEDYYFDIENLKLYYQERHIRLSANEKKLLLLLVDANGKEISYNFISEYLWNGRTTSDTNCRSLVYRLRGKLNFKLIETIPSYGYRLHI